MASVLTPSFRTADLVDSAGLPDDALRARAERDGALLVRALLPPEPVLALRRRVLDACRGLRWLTGDGVVRDGIRLGAYDEDWVALQRELATTREFAALGAQAAIFSLLERLFGEPARGGVGGVCRVTSPAGADLATPPHQDGHFIQRDEFWTVWIPLGDCPRPLGGLAVLPGSHRAGLHEHGANDELDVPEDAVWATSDYACGDALLFQCLTVHRASPNRTHDRARLSADYRYGPASRTPARPAPASR